MKKSFIAFLLSSLILSHSFDVYAGMKGKILGGAAMYGAGQLMRQKKSNPMPEDASPDGDTLGTKMGKKAAKKIGQKAVETTYGSKFLGGAAGWIFDAAEINKKGAEKIYGKDPKKSSHDWSDRLNKEAGNWEPMPKK